MPVELFLFVRNVFRTLSTRPRIEQFFLFNKASTITGGAFRDLMIKDISGHKSGNVKNSIVNPEYSEEIKFK